MTVRAAIDRLLRPRSVALVGASERAYSAGARILNNIIAGGFGGGIYPVNPNYETVRGLKCYKSLADLPEIPDAVFAAIGADKVLEVAREAGQIGIRAMLTNATGFSDAGEEGRQREHKLVQLAQEYGIALCGPNNSGFMNLWDHAFFSTFFQIPPHSPGPVAFISQSGSVSTALSQDDRGLALGYNITTGTEAVLGVTDYANAILDDDRITTLMFFLETLRDPQRFAAMTRRAAAMGKRLVVVKVGRSEAGRRVAAAHSGALVGDNDVYDAYFRYNGVVRATDLDEMIELGLLFKMQPPPVRRGVALMSISGGENGMMVDIADDVGLPICELSEMTRNALRPLLSPYLEPGNPVDVLGMGWNKERFGAILHTLAQDHGIGALAVGIDASASGLAGVRIATDMAEACIKQDLLDCRVAFFTNTAGVGPNREVAHLLAEHGIPFLSGMRPALAALARWAEYAAPHTFSPALGAGGGDGVSVVELAAADESRRFALLRDKGVPMAECIKIDDIEDALAAADRLGFPVVMKATSPNLLHKTELNLIRLALSTPAQVRDAYVQLSTALHRHARGDVGAALVMQPMLPPGVELIIAVRKEPGFGDVVVVGVGGTLVELIDDAATEIGPVTPERARAMLDSTVAGKLLRGYRGAGPYDFDAAAQAIANLSQFAYLYGPELTVLEINPLIVCEKGKGAYGVDVLVEIKK